MSKSLSLKDAPAPAALRTFKKLQAAVGKAGVHSVSGVRGRGIMGGAALWTVHDFLGCSVLLDMPTA